MTSIELSTMIRPSWHDPLLLSKHALGVILYELLTGELPFRGEARMLIVQILKEDPPSPRKLNSRIPRDLETITLKCLQKEPSQRFSSPLNSNADG